MGTFINGMHYQDHELKTDAAGNLVPRVVKGFGMTPVSPPPQAPGSPADMVTPGPSAAVEPSVTYQTKVIEPARGGGPDIQTKEAAHDKAPDSTAAAKDVPATAPPAKK